MATPQQSPKIAAELSRARLILWACLALFVVRALIYLIVLPLNETPDELQHVQQAITAQHWSEIESGAIKRENLMRELRADYYYYSGTRAERPDPATVEADAPPPRRRLVYYRFLGGLLNLLGVESPGMAWYVLRASSIFFGLALIGLTWGSARTAFPDRPLIAAVSCGFLCLLPQYGAMSAAVSTDKPAELAGALFFFLLAKLVMGGGEGRRLSRIGRIGLFLGLAAVLAGLPWIKKTTFFLILVVAAWLTPWWIRFIKSWKYGHALAKTLAYGAAWLFVSLIYFPPIADRFSALLGMPVLRVWGTWNEKYAFFICLLAMFLAWPGKAGLFRAGRRVRSWLWAIALAATLITLAAFPFWAVYNVIQPPLDYLTFDILGIDELNPRLAHQPGMIDQIIHNIHPLSLPFWHQLYLNLTSLVRSFFATYGYMTIPLEAAWYVGVWIMGALGLAGWGRLLYRPGRDWLLSPQQGRLIGLMALGAVLSWAVTLTRQAVFLTDTLCQGRYTYSTLGPTAVLAAVGFMALWPRRWRNPAMAGAALFLAAMDLAGVWQAVVPYFYRVVL